MGDESVGCDAAEAHVMVQEPVHFDPLLMLGAVAIGMAQVADAYLLRSGETQRITAISFSIIEWIWGALCVYLLVHQSHRFPLWLAAMFLAQLLGWVLFIIMQAAKGRAMENFELSPTQALAGGIFGAVYATAALVTWIGVGA